jgi:excisionase family DNA binding protein
MKRRNRRPDWRRIKTLRSYTIDEAATALQVHRNAIRHWIKNGGLPASTERRPHLIHGGDLVAFLKQRRAATRRKCGPGQFFCLKCREPQSPAGGMVDYHPITASRGTLVGMCLTCGTLMRRFVSRAQLAAAARHFDVQVAHPQESLMDTAMPAQNCHLQLRTEPCRNTIPKTSGSSGPTSRT